MTRLVYSRSSLPNEQFFGQPYWWFHYLVIEDGRVTLIEMEQAVLGMNFGRVKVQDSDDWGGMTAEQIVAWKFGSGDVRLREVPKDEGERVLAWLDKREP